MSGILLKIKSVFFKMYEPKKLAAIKPIKIKKKLLKRLILTLEHLLANKYLGSNREEVRG